MKKMIYWMLALLICSAASMNAQVAIGTAGSDPVPHAGSILDLQVIGRGILLPQAALTNVNNFAPLTADGTKSNVGMVVYNTNNKVLGGSGIGLYAWDGSKWRSLEASGSSMTTQPATLPTFNKEGNSKTGNNTVIVTSPAAEGVSGDYTYTIISGNDYASVDPQSSSNGQFSINFNSNTTAADRKVIVLVTDPAGNQTTLVFSQEGDPDVCQGTHNPSLTVSNTTLCTGGAVYMNINNPEEGVNYVWMLGNNQVGNGNNLIATQAGTYTVYAGSTGCSYKASQTINASTTSAPAPVMTIIADNGGVICGGSPIALTTYPSSSVQWYKNGVPAGSPSNSITATATDADKTFIAVVNNGTCSSVASTPLTPTVANSDGNTPSLSLAGLTINGVPMNDNTNAKLCPGTALNLAVINPEAVTYTWTVNGSTSGVSQNGSNATYVIPSNATNIIISCKAQGSGCASSVVFAENNFTVTKPSAPSIVSGGNIVCSGSTIELKVNNPDTEINYQWFNGNSMVGSGSSYVATSGGNYTVQGALGACVSEKSASRSLILMSQPTNLQFMVAPAEVNVNTIATFTANATNATNGYIWESLTATPATATGESASFLWKSSGTQTVKVTASNNCGSVSQTTDVLVKSLKMATPTINKLTVDGCGNGASFRIPSNYADMAVATTFNWTVTVSPAGYTPTIKYSGNKNEEIFIPYDSSDRTYTIKATAEGSKPVSEISPAANVSGKNDTSSAFYMNGNDCYDIKQTQYDPSVIKYGYMNLRKQLDPTADYTYEIIRTAGTATSTYAWTISDPNGLLASNPTGATSSSVNLKFKSSVLTDSRMVNQPEVSLDVTVSCVISVISGGTCGTSIYTLVKTIKMGDRDCCSMGAIDLEGNVYKARVFGAAGCWMTDNLRSTKNNQYTLTENTDYTYPSNKNTYLAYPIYGLHYKWTAASGNKYTENAATGTKTSTVQGICPDGWVLPSDKDWSNLEEELKTNFALYSDGSSATTAGKTVKSTIPVAGVGTSGASKPSPDGFDVLLAGYSGNLKFGTESYFWNSTISGSYTYPRFVRYNELYLNRSAHITNTYYFSVRCMKKLQ